MRNECSVCSLLMKKSKSDKLNITMSKNASTGIFRHRRRYPIRRLQASLTRLNWVCEAYSWSELHEPLTIEYFNPKGRYGISRINENTRTCRLQASLTRRRGVCEADSWNKFHEPHRYSLQIIATQGLQLFAGISKRSQRGGLENFLRVFM